MPVIIIRDCPPCNGSRGKGKGNGNGKGKGKGK